MLKSQNKFTIITVNYKTWYLIEYQLKIYYEFNNPKDFHFVIIDNSASEEEKINLEKVVGKYRIFGNIETIYNIPFLTESNKAGVNLGSSQHGQGLDIGLKKAYEIYDSNSEFKYCIMQDPDWFWAIPNHLNYLKKEMESKNLCAIGGSYNFPDQRYILKSQYNTGKFDFPALFGCAFDLSTFDRTISLMPGGDDNLLGVIEGKDVGWQKRKYFSEKGLKYLSFMQNNKSNLRKMLGNTNKEDLMFEYCKSIFDRKIIAYHLLRGSQVSEDFYTNFATNFLSTKQKENPIWRDNKLAFALFIYESITTGKHRKMNWKTIIICYKKRYKLLLKSIFSYAKI